MSRFTLVVRPDGKALLTAQRQLTDRETVELRDAIDSWDEGEFSTLVVPDCDVVQVVEIDIDLEAGQAILPGAIA